MFIPSFMKTREMSNSFPRTISHAIGLLEENISLQRPFPTASLNVCLISAEAPFHWCKFDAGLCWPDHNLMVILSPEMFLNVTSDTSRPRCQSRGHMGSWCQGFCSELRTTCSDSAGVGLCGSFPHCSCKYLPGFLNILAIASLLTALKWRSGSAEPFYIFNGRECSFYPGAWWLKLGEAAGGEGSLEK